MSIPAPPARDESSRNADASKRSLAISLDSNPTADVSTSG
jgi:hypothetical protein